MRLFLKISDSGLFRYFGPSPPGITRAPNPRTRPRASQSGNVMRPRNRSIGPRRPCDETPASYSSSVG